MIASSAALFAVLATLAAGHNTFHVLPTAVTRDQAIAACANQGQRLAAITGASIERVSAMLPAGASGWIASWNSDTYGGACLQLKAGTITAAASCAEKHLPVCEGAEHPQPPHPEPSCSSSSSSSSSDCSSSSSHVIPEPSISSSSSCTEFTSSSSSSSGCDMSSESWTSECDSSSSSYSCSEDISSDICSSSSSSSSSHGRCDPCCAGVRKLTYQAPFGAGIYLAKVAQRFTVLDVFGPNACNKVDTLAKTLGVKAVLVGADGFNACENEGTHYGTKYVVSRAWALNQPVYDLLNGEVQAANSLYNCYGEYRAIYLKKPLSDLTFVNNNQGNVCYERCKDKPRSCLAVCANQFGRSGPLDFKIGH